MKDKGLKNDLVLRLSGKAEIPSELQIGYNYDVHAQGCVTSLTESDKNDGTHVITYKFEPILIVLITDKGETLKLKDARSKSQLLRGAIWHMWKLDNKDVSQDDYYDRVMDGIIGNIGDVVQMFYRE